MAFVQQFSDRGAVQRYSFMTREMERVLDGLAPE
jgi:hypothetical protein